MEPHPTLERMLRLTPDARVLQCGADLTLSGPSRNRVFPDAPSQLYHLLEQLKDWTSPARVFETAIAGLGPPGGVAATTLLDLCRSAGVLQEAVFDGQTCLARVHVTPGSGLSPAAPPPKPEYPLVLAAAANLTPQDRGWRVASPFAAGQGWVSANVLAGDLADVTNGWTPVGETQNHIAAVLIDAGLLVSARAPRPHMALNDHEIWLHALSRQGTAASAVGAVNSAPVGVAPAIDQGIVSPDAVALPDPKTDLNMQLGQVLARRRSVRTNAHREPLWAQDLADLLWNAARNLGGPQQDDTGFERLARPYPGAGGCHELDIFVALRQPPEPLPAFGRYDAARHALIPIAAPPDDLLRGATTAMAQKTDPQAVLILGARFDRVSWKYADASYVLILKDAGVLLQTLHLTCVALGLGSCILGGGNSHDFAKATGLEAHQQGPVGEIAIFGRKGLTEKPGDTE